MNYRSIIQILLILAIISTICISIIKPKMHEPVMVYNSQFSIEHDDGIKIDEQNISVLVQDTDVTQGNTLDIKNEGGINFVEPKIEDVKPISFTNNETTLKNTGSAQNKSVQNNNIGIKTNNTKVKNNNSKINTTPVKTTSNPVKSNPVQVQAQPVTTNTAPKIDVNKIVSNNQKIINTPAQTEVTPVKTNNTPVTNTSVQTSKPQVSQPVQTKTQQTQAQTKPPVQAASTTTSQPSNTSKTGTEAKPVVLTAAQEEIAWNKWRSNLNNQIMKDSKLPAMPNGIIFKYKFTVDKYGKISNVQTSSTTPGYTPYAIQFIAPVIRSYQGRAILNFPAGSNRTSTEVSGAWKISSNSKLSTPDDYHDIEKIKR